MSAAEEHGLTDGAGGGAIRIEARQMLPLVEIAAQAGVDVGAILSEIGLPADLWAGVDGATAPLSAYFRLRDRISVAVKDETCQLSQRQLLPGTTEFILSHLQDAKTLHDAMKLVADYYNLLHGGEHNSVRKRHGGAVALVTDDRNFPYRIKDDVDHTRFAMECVQIYLFCMFSMIAPESAHGLKSVSVTRPRGSAGAGQLEFWEVPVHYGAPAYEIEYDHEAAQSPVTLPRPKILTASEVYGHVIETVEARGKAGRGFFGAASAVREQMRKGVVDQREVAFALGVSVATLRRRLSEEGASFREIRKEVLNGAAQTLLRRNRPIADIAEALGFSDFRSFNRAFKEWNGLTPRAYVERLSEHPRA
ncbi:MAG: helix-turn-helix domain-containing protein [Alphaproteobacteria bacterium]|nr:helix-turn-helix domain-containing protein [Alphaproteobacteria bacterium]